MADGVIISFGMSVGETTDQVFRWLQRGGVPVVSLVRDWIHPGIPVVCAASDAVMRLGAEYLVGKGHCHFAFIGV